MHKIYKLCYVQYTDWDYPWIVMHNARIHTFRGTCKLHDIMLACTKCGLQSKDCPTLSADPCSLTSQTLTDEGLACRTMLCATILGLVKKTHEPAAVFRCMST